MKSKLETTAEGLIIIYPSVLQSMRRPNSTEGAKALGAPIIVDSENIFFLAFNNEGYVTYFLSNGFEISLKITHDEAKNAYNSAKMIVMHLIE